MRRNRPRHVRAPRREDPPARPRTGPTGVRGLEFTGGRQVSLLPNATLLASGWAEQALTEVGELLAEEAARQEIHVVLGPTINLHRSPLGGRLFEASASGWTRRRCASCTCCR